MARRLYDRFMLHTKIGANRKIRRLKPGERWCHVAGVLAIAAESPVPGHLFIAEGVAATERDIAEHAGVSLAVAHSTVSKLRDLRVLEVDAEAECDYVHDWDEWNPAPKSDPTAADRMRRYRERLRRNDERNGRNGNGAVRQEGEVEGEVRHG